MALTNLNYKSSLNETANNTLPQREPQLMTNVNQRIIKVLASRPIIYHLSSFRPSLNVLFSLSRLVLTCASNSLDFKVTKEEDAYKPTATTQPQPKE